MEDEHDRARVGVVRTGRSFERSTETLWPFVRREDAAEFLVYNEDLEDAQYRLRLYKGRAREVSMDLNASAARCECWSSGSQEATPGTGRGHDAHRGHRDIDSDAEDGTDRNQYHHAEPWPDPGDGREPHPPLVIEDLTVLLRKVHKKYGFTGDIPEAE